MKTKRILGLLLTMAMLLPLCLGAAMAEEENWWEADIWPLERLLELGAEPPAYNAATGQYEISNAKQLLFMTGKWKPEDTNGDGMRDAPRDGYYILTADIDMTDVLQEIGDTLTELSGKTTVGYMPPISCNKKESADKEDGFFIGTFDGNHHAILNHRVERHGSKYAGLFGYLGYKTNKCYIKDLALLNITVIGVKDVSPLSGGCYGTVSNCVFTGQVFGYEAVGGLCSSVKSAGGDFYGLIENCFVNVSVNGTLVAGGLTGEVAGLVRNCFVTGSVTAGDEPFDTVGGIAGLYEAGMGIGNSAVALNGIFSKAGGVKVDRIVGSMEGDSGQSISGNLVWEGMTVEGNPSLEAAKGRLMAYATADELMAKSTYLEKLNWDFSKDWEWIGEENHGHPLPAGFGALKLNYLADIEGNLTAERPVLLPDNPVVREGNANEDVTISARLILPGTAKEATLSLVYGEGPDAGAYRESVPMEAAGDGYAAVFPLKEEGEYGYYLKAVVDGKTLTYPTDSSNAIPYVVKTSVVDATPYQVTVAPGGDCESLGFNWLTDADAEEAELRYRLVGESQWQSAKSTSYRSYLEEGWEEVRSHSVDVEGLTPGTAYEYMVVGIANNEEFQGEQYTVSTLPEGAAFNVMVLSDLQAETADQYDPFVATYGEFIQEKLGGVDFIVTTGDNVKDGYKSGQWADLFDKCEEIFTSVPTILLPGNHEYSGDLFYKNFTARTNLPNGYDDPVIGEYTGWFTVGDACFVMVSTEIYTDAADGDQLLKDRAEYFQKQKAWAKEAFEESGCRWRVVLTHRGPYTTNHNGLLDVPEMVEFCDELGVDLYLNGHDHSYIRVTAKGNEAVAVGEGTNYLTTSPMGIKFDDFVEGIIDDKVAARSGSEEHERQKFTWLTFGDNGIDVSVYELGEAGDWGSYQVIDAFTLTKNQSGVIGRMEAEAPAVNDPEQPVNTEQPTQKQGNAGLWVALIILAAAGVVIAVVVMRKKKKAK